MANPSWSHNDEAEQPPFSIIPVPEHVSTGAWQQSYYDAQSSSPVVGFEKLPSGSVSISNGRRTGEDFPDSGPWKQV